MSSNEFTHEELEQAWKAYFDNVPVITKDENKAKLYRQFNPAKGILDFTLYLPRDENNIKYRYDFELKVTGTYNNELGKHETV